MDDILGSLEGFSVGEGDFIVIDGAECEVTAVHDQGETILVDVLIDGDRDQKTIDPWLSYEIWGE